jgi:hypothetical protein
VTFDFAAFSAAKVDLSFARFTGEVVSFHKATFSGDLVTFRGSRAANGAVVDLSTVAQWTTRLAGPVPEGARLPELLVGILDEAEGNSHDGSN